MSKKHVKCIADTVKDEDVLNCITAIEEAETKGDVIALTYKFGGKIGYSNVAYIMFGATLGEDNQGHRALIMPDGDVQKPDKKEDSNFERLLAAAKQRVAAGPVVIQQ